jgi:hypothetical protein
MGVSMTNEGEVAGNGQDHNPSRLQELIRAWTDTRLAYHATTDSEEKRLLAERSELIAGEIPAEPGIQDFMEIFEQSLAPKSLYRYRFYTSDDLKGLSDGALTHAYVESVKAQVTTEHVGRINRLVDHRNQIFQELRRRDVAHAAMIELADHVDENVRKSAKSDLKRIEKARVTPPESRPEPPRSLPWQILWQCDHAPPPGLTRDEIAERLRRVLPDVCDTLMDLALPAIGLWPQRMRADRAPTASRFGGVPWAPPHWKWPTVEGEPLLFVGHINCAELRGVPGAELLPPSGLLAFFGDHDAVEACRIEAQGDIAVYHWTEVDQLVPAVAPIEPIKTLLECPLAFRPLIDLPDLHSRAIRQLRLTKEQASLYAAEWKAIRRFGFPDDADYYSGFSKLLGWPALVQWRDLDRFEDFEDALLLLQVDDYCNGEDTQDWGSGGSLYYFMPQQALQDRNFAACEFEIQFT